MNQATSSRADIADWRPEDTQFWESKGKSIAYRNLWISIPNLLCGFAVWAMWGIITVQMLNLGFPFKPVDMFTLTAIAGLMGATMRIPASFFIRLAGGRNTIFLTSAMLIIPALWTGIALQDKATPLWVFQACAFLSGIGGGNFACSMSNISGFFPKRLQGTGLPAPTGLGLLNMWVALPLTIVATLMAMKLAAFGEMKGNIAKQFEIFKNKHTWSLTLLYIVTFGSFIGFSMALPLSITVIFGVSHVPDAAGIMQHTLKNPNAPSALTYAWIGPFVGALIRPVGGWISDKVGGSIVTQVISAIMVGASAGVGYVMMQAYGSATPEQYFSTFMWLFVLLFAASGIGNGSTFRTIGVIFDRQQAGPALGWTSAVAAYGAFIAPVVIGAQIKAGTPQTAMYGFAIFYALCLVLNWWFYLRAGSEIKNP